MNLQNRILCMGQLRECMLGDTADWNNAKTMAEQKNPWFTPEFIERSVSEIANSFLNTHQLEEWTSKYDIPDERENTKNIGIVMAGNIPMVGFHDMLCVFVSGHNATIKVSSKDDILIPALIRFLHINFPETERKIGIAEQLKGCDAYIATGGNQAATHFEYYFSKYPSIIRKNRTSVAILTGSESEEDLSKLSDDVHLYFGLGCRNVTKIYVPHGYDFINLIQAFNKYGHFIEHHRYKNNYDYQLSLLLLNNKPYMSSEGTLLTEEASIFSPLGMLYYEFYDNKEELTAQLKTKPEIQCIVGKGEIGIGEAQSPRLSDYADGVDTMAFLCGL
jgi:hypothetical protein